MADMTQNDPNSALGQIQALLGNYGVSPEERKKTIERRDLAQQQYLGVLQEPMPDQGAINRMVNDYLMRYAKQPNQPAASAIAAIGAEGQRSQEMAQNQLLRRQLAAEQEAKMAGEALKEADLFARGLLGAKGIAGRQPSPEQLRTVHNSLRNEAAQIAKDYQFKSANEREAWIQSYADRGLENYIEKWATLPLGPRGEQQAAQPMATSQPTIGAGQLPLPSPQDTAQRNIGLISKEMQRPEYTQDPTRQLILQQELQREQQALGQQPAPAMPAAAPATPTVTPARPTAAIEPPLRNRPQEAAEKQGAKEMASAYVKDYETLQQEATAAAQQKAAFDALQKIRPNTGLFANTEQVIGSLFSALGQDPNSPTIQNAMKTRSAEQILSQLTNASLKAEKGVQTKTDEVRIYKEFPKTSDFQKVWDFSVKLGQERAQRKLDQRDYFESVAAQNNGTPIGARRKWDQEMQGDPITQYLGGKLIFRSDFIKAYNNKYPDLGTEGAVAKWREMEKEYQARGGRK